MDPTPQTPSPDPYAAYGGRATDPYAAYGGKLADAGGSPPPVSVSNPAPAVASPPRPQPAQDAITDGLTANPKGEGTYEVKGPRGIIRVPYSSVRAAAKQGYTFTNNQDLTTYAKDYEADPINEGAVDHYLNTAPWWDVPSHIVNQLRGMGAGVESTVAGAEKIGKRMSGHGDEPLRPAEQALQVEAAKPGHNPVEDQGNLEENIGEFFSGDELLGLLGKSAEALPAIDKLKQAQQVASTLSQNPLIAKLLRIGVSAVKNGAIAGGQTYAKTGGDTGAAVAAGATTAIGGAALEGAGEYVGGKIASHAATNENIAGVDVNVPAETARPKESPQQKAGKQVIKNAAQGTAQGHLEEVNELCQKTEMSCRRGPDHLSSSYVFPVAKKQLATWRHERRKCQRPNRTRQPAAPPRRVRNWEARREQCRVACSRGKRQALRPAQQRAKIPRRPTTYIREISQRRIR
jgi:hypothetical protein